jgi:hypothetical protein
MITGRPYQRQHHHPQFLLRGFCDKTNHVWLHRPGKAAERKGCRNACFVPWFYSYIDADTGAHDNHIETEINGAIDQAFATILRQKVFKFQSLNADEKFELARALAYQSFRTPAARRAIMTRYGSLTQRMAIEKLLKEAPEARTVAKPELFPDIPQDDSFKRYMCLLKMFHLAKTYTQSYFQKEWVFLRTAQDNPFIWSDTSYAVDDPRDPGAAKVNQFAPQTRVTIPLSKTMTLILHKGIPIIGGHDVARRTEVEEINTRIAQQAQEYVISDSKFTRLPNKYCGSISEIRD